MSGATLGWGAPERSPRWVQGDLSSSEYVLLAVLSLALHAWVWQLASRLPPRPDVEAKPLPIEITLVAPPAPKTLAPPPPPAAAPAPALTPVPLPKPAPRPKPESAPKPKPKPLPKPPPEPQPEPQTSEASSAPAPPAAAAPATSAPLAGPVAAAPAELPLVPAHTRATSRRNPKPEYPAIARRRGWQGTVLLRIQVGVDGLPASVEVAESSGREVLDQSALRTVRRWTFSPALRGDRPVASTLTLSIVFKLD